MVNTYGKVAENTGTKKEVTKDEAKEVGDSLGIRWDLFNSDQFRRGMNVELEHGTRDADTNVLNDDLISTGKIALAHLREYPDYYDRLENMEKEADDFWNKKNRSKNK